MCVNAWLIANTNTDFTNMLVLSTSALVWNMADSLGPFSIDDVCHVLSYVHTLRFLPQCLNS